MAGPQLVPRKKPVKNEQDDTTLGITLVLANIVIGIVILPFGFFSYLAIGFGEMSAVCLFLDIIPFGLVCGAVGIYCTLKFPHLFWLYPLLFSAPSIVASLGMYGLNAVIESDPYYMAGLIVPIGMFFTGFFLCFGAAVMQRNKDKIV